MKVKQGEIYTSWITGTLYRILEDASSDMSFKLVLVQEVKVSNGLIISSRKPEHVNMGVFFGL